MESELPFLASLNVAQKAAVVHPPDVALQILAGPGSGKTKVLTSRIAYLILRHAITPSSVCAVTFTNKAANEMKERLQHLIGKEKTRQLKMGTFHALCAQFLRKHGKLVGIGENFTICDTSESESLIARCINSFKGNIAKVDAEVKPGTIRSTISNAKSRGFGPREFLEDAAKKWVKPDAFTEVVGEIFREYNNELRASNSLDFDDLLLYGVRLFKRHQKVAAWCQHILVDEFQDTNCVQYEIMKLISETHRCVTIVGDPDQSIYGWRSADILNISNMQRDFPLTEQIYLEQNYRSTGSILNVSLAIISKDDKRIKKSLRTSYNEGPRPMLCHFGSEHQEAQFAASEIKRIVAYSGGMFGWKDFVVLLRFNALSRGLESALQAEGIPYRVLKGHKFFDRAEIKDLLAYLQVLDNPSFLPAFTRIVNVPPRGLGEKSVSQIIARAENDKKSPLETMERIADGKIPDTKPPLRKKIAPFVKVMHEMRKAAESGAGPAELLRQLIGLIEYEEYMKRTQPDAESRLDNILELINFASQEHQAIEIDPVKVDTPTTTPVLGDATGLPKRHTPYGGVSASSESTPGTSPVPADTQKETPLRLFLQTSMLSTDSDTSEDGSENKVTISTCHAAKGLEWPVVFVPAAEDKVFPFARSEDEYEERRLLYVACTRAQCLLYVLHAEKRMVAGSTLKKTLTPFVSSIGNDLQQLFSNELPDLSSSTVEIMAKIAGRPTPDTKEIRRRVKDFPCYPIVTHLPCHNGLKTWSPLLPTPITRRLVAWLTQVHFESMSVENNEGPHLPLHSSIRR
ncbi:P-loop containing nucleoside triphosphate hydrolase protein [Gloeopeniophorella convolvens]|nr:P-loop containing nucleoside triphosphate hydrolase protein [Gloeopeniophorella convolvens]